jgi:beta-lactamase regulating signal transducer with metallopeptidase domain
MNAWMSQTMVHALGWTLVHFLWEGLVIAALLAVGLRMFKKSPAHHKYLAGCAAMALMAIAPAVTLFLVAELNVPPPRTTGPATSPWTETTGPAAKAPPALVVTAKPDASVMDISRRLEMLFPWLVLGWVAGVCGLSGRLLAGWLQVRRLRRTATHPLPPPWPEKLAALAQRLGVNRSIQLLQSALIEVPTVIGWLRPVILLPVGCVTGLTSRQLESIIAHELAHIRRHDYLINLLQSGVETLLFYHPAVWWVSRRIRDERENCCDDLAVEVSGDLVGYARALATLEELRPASAQLMLAAGGAPLLQRIRRLAGQPERSAGRASWPVAGIALLLVLGILGAGMREHRVAAQNFSPPADHAAPKIITLAQATQTSPGTEPVAARANPVRSADDPPEVNIKAKFVEITGKPGDSIMLFSFNKSVAVSTFTGLLTDSQFHAAISALEQRDGTQVLSAPEVTMESGRQAQIQSGDMQTILLPGKGTNATTTNKFFGETLDTFATVSTDKKSISMTLIPSVTEFLGYEYVNPTVSTEDYPSADGTSTSKIISSPIGSRVPLPLINSRTMTANVTAWDGQTVVIGGFISDSTNTASQPVKKELLVFVTANVIKPDGRLYNSDEERNSHSTGAPPPQGSTNR